VARILVGLGDDFESANAAVMYHARDIVSAAESGELQEEYKALKKGDEATKLWAENWYDGLTYCEFKNSFSCYFPVDNKQARGMPWVNDSLRRKFSRQSKHWHRIKSMLQTSSSMIIGRRSTIEAMANFSMAGMSLKPNEKHSRKA